MTRLNVTVGRTTLKNPLIAGSAEHLIEAGGVRRALRAGGGAVVVKSTNESERGRDQLQRAEYMLLDEEWREIAWTPDAPSTAYIACRSGLTPQSFEVWFSAGTLAPSNAAMVLKARRMIEDLGGVIASSNEVLGLLKLPATNRV